jgi:cell division protease FtsH
VAMSVDHADPVHRITIIPRSMGALGATLQLPTDERYLRLREELLDHVCVMLGGRAAEQAALGDVSTGAETDLERATETARQMVCRFGMSTRLGPQTFGRSARDRGLAEVLRSEERGFSERTAARIDGEVSEILATQHRRALGIVTRRADALRALAGRLVEAETLDATAVAEVLAGATPDRGERRALDGDPRRPG